ncbi:MAG: tyrosine-type recombinase/integrase [Spirochaetales bacterium]|jgi:integrase|nr:tyrosine-type recombinase/integrase [Spirochaetales bacterium]
MKIHNDFTLYWRVIPSGKRVVYYYAYDGADNRLGGWSTGETTLTAARLKCNRLLREGKLIPNSGFMPTFAEYAQGWWEWESCAYLKKRRKRYSLTQTYADNNKKNLKNQLLPYFGNMPVDRITRDDVESWFDDLIEKDYQNTTINGYYGTLKTMLIEAVARKIIPRDPTENMGRLVNDRREIKIITREEFRKLFVGDWKRVWDNDRISCAANKLAALTGMRASEVLGLRGGFVYEEHIYLCKQYDEYGYRDTKTKDIHNIPLPENLIKDLKELKRMNGDGFVFSLDGGATPVCRKTMYQDFHRALRNIGLSDDEIADRHLHLHGWRHFFNTELLKGGLTIPQAQAVTGHKSDRMTEWYCHFDPSEFAKAKEVQENLLLPEVKHNAFGGKPGRKAGKPERKPEGRIIPLAGRGKALALKRA